MKQYKVSFNEEHLKLFKNLQKHKLTSQTFAEFVRSCFYEKIDLLRFQPNENRPGKRRH